LRSLGCQRKEKCGFLGGIKSKEKGGLLGEGVADGHLLETQFKKGGGSKARIGGDRKSLQEEPGD